MEKEFLDKVLNLFAENGAKTVTMGDIAKEMGISKRTLYQKYKNKEALLEDVIAYKLDEGLKEMHEINQRVENPLEVYFYKHENFQQQVESNKSVFVRQLIKYYPSIFEKYIANFSDQFIKFTVENVKKGREMGLYREDFDEEVYADFVFRLFISYDFNPDQCDTFASRYGFNFKVIDFYLNAITTDAGRHIVKKYTQNL
ncbi:TetR/AcrR family transcriptional regulator [Cruoricaptor ignavus]|uniref:TetR/AcrR family transcriptional regulator n=1 Tax=Cruoricaptor ignavus TaxID=1118202 RepID=A0A7M1T3I3_9FLAO|nr:TetR/AcrR family transcriptional regulator [Cruoricaptor ignavus]QOR74369.1 TetR/AcrR family transcriptional regulator [Cruoricaptor ignavus]